MGGYCIICKWRSDYAPRRMFHKFPTDPTERKAWAKVVGRSKVKPNVTLCSLHFKRSCYTHRENGQPYLKRGSVPTQHIKEQPIPGRLRSNIKRDSKSGLGEKKFNCEFCKRKFLNKCGVKSHLYHVHKKGAPTKLRKAVKPPNIVESDTKMPETESLASKAPKLIKPSFECPVCEKQFSIYFTAFQHIQKLHCVDSKGRKVSPLSLDIVKPVRIEVCICNQTIRSDKPHDCPCKVDKENSCYYCLGCKQEYDTLTLFQAHLKGVHGNNIESYFFPARSEFNAWKNLLENQTRTNYVALTDKTIYHCSHQSVLSTSAVTQLCPSTIVVKKLPNGFHMTYYKTHIGHDCEQYNAPEAHKKNCITTFYNDTEEFDLNDEDEKDLYLQFKKVMSSIVLDAAKINISTLEVLLGKAFEMTMILNSYDEDDDDVSNQKMSDEQISRVLEDKTIQCKVEPLQHDKHEEITATNDKPLKRKREPLQRDSKKVRSNIADEEFKIKIESPVTPARMIQSPPSFNDSYKSFVDQTIMSNDSKKDKKKPEIVKTKIGQFKSNCKIEPTKIITPKTDTTKIVTPKTDTTKHVTPKTASKTATPKTVNKSMTTTEKSRKSQMKMPVIVNVRSVKSDIINVRPVKPDVKYEVKERENDCNILILKI